MITPSIHFNNINALFFLGVNSFEKVIDTFQLAKSMVSEVLSATEMIDAKSIDACLEQFGFK